MMLVENEMQAGCDVDVNVTSMMVKQGQFDVRRNVL